MSISSTWKDTVHNPLKDQWRSFTGQKQADKLARDQMEMQTQFAKMGIQWKVADARKAGIHPLAALGAQTHSPSSVSGGSSSSGPQALHSIMGAIGMITNLVTAIKGQVPQMQMSQPVPQASPSGSPAGQILENQVTQKSGQADTYNPYNETSYNPFIWTKYGPNQMKLHSKQDVQGIEEAPEALKSRQAYIISLKSRGKAFQNPSNRKGYTWKRFKKEMYAQWPKNDPGRGMDWYYDLSDGTMRRLKANSGKNMSNRFMASNFTPKVYKKKTLNPNSYLPKQYQNRTKWYGR